MVYPEIGLRTRSRKPSAIIGFVDHEDPVVVAIHMGRHARRELRACARAVALAFLDELVDDEERREPVCVVVEEVDGVVCS